MSALDGADRELLAAARLLACRWQPYLSSAPFSLHPLARPGMGTFAVDRNWRLYVDMDQARSWGVKHTAGVLIHEANHLLRRHHDRANKLGVAGDAQHRAWNLAADAAINDDLVRAEIPLPDPVLADHLGVDPHGTEESMWHQLQAAGPITVTNPPGNGDGCGSGAGAVPHPAELDHSDHQGTGIDEVDANAVRREVAHQISQTGPDQHISRGLLIWADELLAPTIDWRQQLRGAFRGTIRQSRTTDPSWNRPSRRPADPDLLLPGSIRRPAPRVAVVIDTSASMTKELLHAAAAELDSLIHHGGTRQIEVIACDDVAKPPQRVRRIPDLEITTGGLTDLRVGIAAAADLRPRPDVIVVLTDGYTPWPSAAPPNTSVIAVVIGGSDDALPTGRGLSAIRVPTDS